MVGVSFLLRIYISCCIEQKTREYNLFILSFELQPWLLRMINQRAYTIAIAPKVVHVITTQHIHSFEKFGIITCLLVILILLNLELIGGRPAEAGTVLNRVVLLYLSVLGYPLYIEVSRVELALGKKVPVPEFWGGEWEMGKG